ncbi:MAG: hypothetical protein HY673_18740 [Chloroflexi bacterium]|nr:hypothetical protein [Chloroflexota bacterium]
MNLVKLIVLLALTAALVTGAVAPSLAANDMDNPRLAGEPQQGKKDGQGKGTVQVVKGAVTEKTGTVVKIDGREVGVNDWTKYKVPGVKNATLADVKVGMAVVARTVEEGGKLYARQLGVAPGKPPVTRQQGKITAYSYNPPNGGAITIQDKWGKLTTFQIVADKFTIKPAGAIPKVGDLATVVSNNEVPLVATGLVIRYPPLKVSGAVTAIDESAKTITVGATVLKYDNKTVFVLRGVPGLKVTQQATVLYRQQADGSLLAKRVQVQQ